MKNSGFKNRRENALGVKNFVNREAATFFFEIQKQIIQPTAKESERDISRAEINDYEFEKFFARKSKEEGKNFV